MLEILKSFYKHFLENKEQVNLLDLGCGDGIITHTLLNVDDSILAIHHLTMDKKMSLFKNIYSHLHMDGYFLNIDVVLAPTVVLEQWYLSLWKEWIDERKNLLGIEGNYYDDIIRRYKDNKDNKPDTLNEQLNVLEDIGFKDVDCFYKYGIFTIGDYKRFMVAENN